MEYERIQHPKNNDVGPNTQGESHNGRECKCGGPKGAPNRVAGIARYAIEQERRIRTRYPFFHQRGIAKAKHRIPVRLFLRHSSCDVVLDAHLDMRPEFSIDLLVQLPARKKI
jgi:hypothetical protein